MKATRRGLLGLVSLLPGCAARFASPQPLADAPPPDGVMPMDDGAELPYRAWLPPRPTAAVLALHGFTDSRDFFEYPAPAFLAAGMAIYAPDQRGFGAGPRRGYWAGSARMTADAVTAFAFVQARHPGLPVYLVGESMGGGVAILAAPTCRPAAVGLISAAVWPRAMLGPVYRSGLWLANYLLPGYVATGRDVPRTIYASDNLEALKRLAEDPLTLEKVRLDMMVGLSALMDQAAASVAGVPAPALWLYGGHDQLIPRRCTLAAWRQAPQIRKAYYPADYHLLLRDHQRAVPTTDLVEFLQNPNRELVSTAEIAAAGWMANS